MEEPKGTKRRRVMKFDDHELGTREMGDDLTEERARPMEEDLQPTSELVTHYWVKLRRALLVPNK